VTEEVDVPAKGKRDTSAADAALIGEAATEAAMAKEASSL